MTPVEFAVFFIFGSAALALWIDTRFPDLTPAHVWRISIHLGIAFLCVQVLPHVGYGFTSTFEPRLRSFVWLFAFVFPALTYLLLAALWVVKWAQATLGSTGSGQST